MDLTFNSLAHRTHKDGGYLLSFSEINGYILAEKNMEVFCNNKLFSNCIILFFSRMCGTRVRVEMSSGRRKSTGGAQRRPAR